MARNEATGDKPKRTRKPQAPRPMYILYRQDAAGELEIIAATRDPKEVIEVMDANPGVKRYTYHPQQASKAEPVAQAAE